MATWTLPGVQMEKNRKNIDDIFGDRDHLYFCQAFLKFISDRFTITLRIALFPTTFVDDD